ncbi:hypothetical protein LBMAG27_19570 [Bacteroidota bacterium]|nr:hypothetical protein LBMAG27_19570 [Bacteroidota bacterium]
MISQAKSLVQMKMQFLRWCFACKDYFGVDLVFELDGKVNKLSTTEKIFFMSEKF